MMPNMFQTVMSNLFSKPATRRFPAEVREPVEGFRGQVKFDMDKCIFCGACANKCPTNAIQVSKPEQSLKFDLFRCIGCACCEEACKQGCVQLNNQYYKPSNVKPGYAEQGAPVLTQDNAE